MSEKVSITTVESATSRLFLTAWGIAATVLGVLYTAVLTTIAALTVRLWPDTVDWIARLWARLIMRTSGAKVEFEGLENIAQLGPFVLTANHQSYFDIFALLAYFPRETRFIAKKEWFKLPVFGYALKHSKHVVVDRQHGQSIRKGLIVGDDDGCLCIFAEGHRYNDDQVHPFKDGAAWLAIRAQVPCVPAAIIGGSTLFPRGAKIVSPGGRMKIRLGRPIETKGLKPSDRRNVTHHLEEAVRSMYSRA